MEIVICEDDKSCRSKEVKIISKFIKSHGIDATIKEYSDYNDEFIKDISSNKNRIYILDIETPSNSGVDVARIIRRNDVESIIIFVTGYEKYEPVVLKKHIMCLTYIDKFDNLEENLIEALEDAIHFKESNKVIQFKDNNILYTIQMNNILYITRDTYDRKILIVCLNNQYKIRDNLKDIECKLSSSFVRTHKSCIVNKDHVVFLDYSNKIIRFDNGDEIDLLSSKYKKDINL